MKVDFSPELPTRSPPDIGRIGRATNQREFRRSRGRKKSVFEPTLRMKVESIRLSRASLGNTAFAPSRFAFICKLLLICRPLHPAVFLDLFSRQQRPNRRRIVKLFPPRFSAFTSFRVLIYTPAFHLPACTQAIFEMYLNYFASRSWP